MNRAAGLSSLAFLAGALALLGCEGGKALPPYPVATGGNAAHGKELIQNYGCGACHIVPGVQGARGLVGPPLLYFGRRTMIAGELPEFSRQSCSLDSESTGNRSRKPQCRISA